MKKSFSEARLKSKALYKFLKKYRCLREFVENIETANPNYEVVIKYKKLGDTNSLLLLFEKFNSSIEFSFVWRHTPQGHDYWYKLDRDFNIFWLKLGDKDNVYDEFDAEYAAFVDYDEYYDD